MNREIEKEGRTIEEAIEAALSELGAAREDAQIEILEKEHKGMFGFMSRPARVKVSVIEDDEIKAGGIGAQAEQFLQNIFEKMGLPVEIATTVEENEIKVEMTGDEMGAVIGRRGETLDALQYLTTLAVNRSSEEYFKVSLDTENYRSEREKTLVSLANRLAAKAKRTKRNVSLEPMNSYERKIIHSALQDDKEVSTFSVGDEPNRKIIISPKGAPRRGGGYGQRPRQDMNRRPDHRSEYRPERRPDHKVAED